MNKKKKKLNEQRQKNVNYHLFNQKNEMNIQRTVLSVYNTEQIKQSEEREKNG